MRLRVLLEVQRPLTLPIDHYTTLRGTAYKLLHLGNPELARFLHDEGYAVPRADDSIREDTRRYKLFTFSQLRVPRHRRQFQGNRLRIAPGIAEWLISSPREDFLKAQVDGLLQSGNGLTVGEARLPLAAVEAVAPPTFRDGMRFACVTPIVASVPSPDRATPYYLRPRDGERFSEAIRQNLLRKHQVLHGALPNDQELTLTFDADYLESDRHGGTKKSTVGDIDVIGAFAPFTLSGSLALMHTAYECGLGQLSSSGFGMIARL